MVRVTRLSCPMALLLGILVPSAPAAESEDYAARVDPLIEPYLENEVLVGLTVGVIKEGESWTRGYGAVSADNADRPNAETLYEIGSITKAFTGILLADAVLRERLALDAPIAALLPAAAKPNETRMGKITLKHLATHVSGLPRMPSNWSPANRADPYADYDKEKLYAFLASYESQRKPESVQEYSNLGFGLLGTLLANNAEQPYGTLLRARILDPLDMNQTTIDLSARHRARLAPPHDGSLNADSNWNFKAFAGAGAIRSTVNDMLKFAAANLSPSEEPIGKAIELAWKIHQRPVAAPNFAMGLGWHVARDGSTRWHNGQTGGYHTMLLINREAAAAVVVLANTATGEVDVLAEQIFRSVLGNDERPRAFPKMVEVSKEAMQKLVGVYEMTPQFRMTVKVVEDKLMVGATGQPFLRVYPESQTEWHYRAVKASLSFNFDDAGNVKSLILHQNGRDMRAMKME